MAMAKELTRNFEQGWAAAHAAESQPQLRAALCKASSMTQPEHTVAKPACLRVALIDFALLRVRLLGLLLAGDAVVVLRLLSEFVLALDPDGDAFERGQECRVSIHD